MGFSRLVDTEDLGRYFNSALSSNFRDMYDSFIQKELKEESHKVPHKTFAPSQMKCDRLSFFRLRGAEPDKDSNLSTVSKFQAELGECIHLMVQKRLKDNLGSQWINVSDYLEYRGILDKFIVTKKSDYETFLECLDPPVRFACDGILKIGDKYYLLEIKTCESNSLRKLGEPKPQHVDQVTAYSMLLEIDDVIFLYVDRQFGDFKVFEYNVSSLSKLNLKSRVEYVINSVSANVAPSRLPSGDIFCSYCKYKSRCKEWG